MLNSSTSSLAYFRSREIGIVISVPILVVKSVIRDTQVFKTANVGHNEWRQLITERKTKVHKQLCQVVECP